MIQPLRRYPELEATLRSLLLGSQTILDRQFRGLYLLGSLALGDFDPARSDIDFVVVTSGDLAAATVSHLAAMHERLAAGRSKWGRELEGTYISEQALRRYDPADAMHPHIERGGKLRMEHHHSDWIIQCYVLRGHGLALAGPPPHTLLDPIPPAALRQAVLDLLWWWELQLEDTSRLEQSGYQSYAILTMCRILYTMQHGTVVSKPTAARWAQARLNHRLVNLVERALIWQPHEQLDALQETLIFIRHTLRQVRRDTIGE